MNILIVGPSWVGDMVMAQSLFMALKSQHPNANIDVLAPAWSRPIIEAMPEVRAAIDMPVGHGALQLGVRRAVADSLKPVAYDRMEQCLDKIEDQFNNNSASQNSDVNGKPCQLAIKSYVIKKIVNCII